MYTHYESNSSSTTRIRRYLFAGLAAIVLSISAISAQDFQPPKHVYVLPDGRIQSNPNVNAKKVAWEDLMPEQRQAYLAKQKPKVTVQDRLKEFGERMTPVLVDRDATCVRVLLACDTHAQNIAPGVAINRERMEQFFAEAFKGCEHLVKVTSLMNDDLTAENILEYYRKLDSKPTETLVFYYAGHGGSHKTELGFDHYLALTHGKALMRADLRKVMSARPHQCLILLTDCCSTSIGLTNKKIMELREKHKALFGNEDPTEMPKGVDHRTTNSLFLRHKGQIDITAATPSRDQFAWISNDRYGGCFTYSLDRVLRSDVNVINKGKDRKENRVTWKQAFGCLQVGAAGMSLGRPGLPPLEELKKAPRERDHLWQWAEAFSFH